METAAGCAAGGAAAGNPGGGTEAMGSEPVPPVGSRHATSGGAGHRADCGQHRRQPAPGSDGRGSAAAAGVRPLAWRRLPTGLADPCRAGPTEAGAPHREYRGWHAELRPGSGAGPLRVQRLTAHCPAWGDLGGGACCAREWAGYLVEETLIVIENESSMPFRCFIAIASITECVLLDDASFAIRRMQFL